MKNFTVTVNGRERHVKVEPDTPLLYVLRNDLDLKGPRFGCGLGQCGACTVLMDNRAVRSCSLPVSRVGTARIVTIEGLASPGGQPHHVQQAFIDEQAFQCGYCLNGWVLTAKALLDTNPKASDAEVRRACESLICRCGSHTRIFSAIQRAAKSQAVKA